MTHPDFAKLPVVPFDDRHFMAKLFPFAPIRLACSTARNALDTVLSRHQPWEDPEPVAMILGWNPKGHAHEFMSLPPGALQNGPGKLRMAKELRELLLSRKTGGNADFYAIVLIYPGMIRSLQPSEDSANLIHIVHTRPEGGPVNGTPIAPEKTEVVFLDVIWQDGQRVLAAEIERAPGKSPWITTFHDLGQNSAVPAHNGFWTILSPALCALPYAEAILTANFGVYEEEEEQQP